MRKSIKLVSTILAVPKGDGGKHLGSDYHALNKVTRKFIWPMPKVEDIFLQLNSAKYFFNIGSTSRIPPYSLGQIINP